MTPPVLFWLALGALLTTCLAGIGAKAFSEFSRSDLEEICRRRKAEGRLGQILRKHRMAALAAESLQVVATAVAVAAGTVWISSQSMDTGRPEWGSLVVSGVLLVIALLAAEIWLPWGIVRLWATPFVYYTWRMWQVVSAVFSVPALGAYLVETILRRAAGREPESHKEEGLTDEIRTIVDEGHREGLLEEDAREMIEGVIELGDVDVSEIMTPRTEMVSLPVTLSWDEMVELVTHCEHTRIPVYDTTRDDIVGLLYAKDLLPELAKPPEQRANPWSRLLREAYFVPETKPVDVLLQEFQRTRSHVAIVLDEYGGVAGLVSLEDALEEIVGEIVDEYDKDLVEGIHILEEGVAEVLGKVHIDEVNERLGTELPEDNEYDTIAGYVFSELGHVPVDGEILLRDSVQITVTEVTSRRIERVRIEILDPSRRQSV